MPHCDVTGPDYETTMQNGYITDPIVTSQSRIVTSQSPIMESECSTVMSQGPIMKSQCKIVTSQTPL